MTSDLAVTVLLLALPTVAFFGGVFAMEQLSGRAQLLKSKMVDPKSLNTRFLGYDIEAVNKYWSWLGDDGRAAEKTFLMLDLLFPLLYGGALFASLLVGWNASPHPFSIAWIPAVVGITVVADWIENLLQLDQLARYMEGRKSRLDALRIRVASVATCAKLWSFACAVAMLVILLACRLCAPCHAM